jgi:hypothetical protein
VGVYGFIKEGGCISNGGRGDSIWWNNLNIIRVGGGVGVGRWFDDNLWCKVG